MSIKNKSLNILILISILINIFFGLMLYKSQQEKNDSARWVAHTYEVIQKSTELLSKLKDAETGQRGYLLTGKEQYLEPYKNALNDILSDLKELEQLTSDNALQTQNINNLKLYVNNKIIELDQTIQIFKLGNKSEAYKIVNSDIGRISMDSIRQIIQRMLYTEDELLIIRNDKFNNVHFINDMLAISGLLFMCLMSVISLFMINRQQKKNDSLINQLGIYNKNLEMDVEKRTKELQIANQELIRINAEKNKFLGMAAHDLKSPLNNLNGLINILTLNDHVSEGQRKEIFVHILKSVRRMTKLISDLLDINRIEEGSRSPVEEEVEIHELVEMVVFGFKETSIKKNIIIHFTSALKNVVIKSDKGYLIQIMENLVSNAFKFTLPGHSLFIDLNKEADKIQIEIRDEGQGIRPEEMQFLFSKYNRLSTKPTDGEDSTGLGLSIVKHLVDQLNGHIRCVSEFGKGTTFIIEFAA